MFEDGIVGKVQVEGHKIVEEKFIWMTYQVSTYIHINILTRNMIYYYRNKFGGIIKLINFNFFIKKKNWGINFDIAILQTFILSGDVRSEMFRFS